MVIQWVAHRGDCQHEIENTLASISAALEQGITAIEIDIQLSKDEIPVLFHDRNLLRMTGVGQPIAAFNFDELMQFTLSPHDAPTSAQDINEPKTAKDELAVIPSLAQVVSLIQQYKNVTLFVEVKRVNFLHFSYQTVYQQILAALKPILNQVVLISFSYRFLRLCRKYSNQAIAYILPNWQQYTDKMLQKLTPEYIFCDLDFVPKNFDFTKTTCKWALYEIGTVEQALLYSQRGVTHLESFTPVKLITCLAKIENFLLKN